MNRLIYGILASAAVSICGCKSSLQDEHLPSDRAIEVASLVDRVVVSSSKSAADNTSALTGIQFLRKDATGVPSGFNGATLVVGNRATDGKVTFTPTVPNYNPNNSNAYFAAYYPAGVVASQVVTWPIDGKTDILVTKSIYDAGTYVTPITSGTMTFKHCLAQLEVVCKTDPTEAELAVQAAWGNITKIELLATPTSMSYAYATNAVASGATLGAVALLQRDFNTPLSTVPVTLNTSNVVTAAGMFAPALSGTAPLRIKIYTTTEPAGREVSAQLVQGGNQGFTVGLRHRATLIFQADNKAIQVLSTAIDPWDTGYSSSNDLEK